MYQDAMVAQASAVAHALRMAVATGDVEMTADQIEAGLAAIVTLLEQAKS